MRNRNEDNKDKFENKEVKKLEIKESSENK